MTATSAKCVFVGDVGVGQKSLILTFLYNEFPHDCVPSCMHPSTVKVVVDSKEVGLEVWHTAGAQDYDRLRPLCYPNTDVFIVCFSVVSPASFTSVFEKWIPELRHHAPHTPFVLLGTQTDLRDDPVIVSCVARQLLRCLCQSANYLLQLSALNEKKQAPITSHQGHLLARQIKGALPPLPASLAPGSFSPSTLVQRSSTWSAQPSARTTYRPCLMTPFARF